MSLSNLITDLKNVINKRYRYELHDSQIENLAKLLHSDAIAKGKDKYVSYQHTNESFDILLNITKKADFKMAEKINGNLVYIFGSIYGIIGKELAQLKSELKEKDSKKEIFTKLQKLEIKLIKSIREKWKILEKEQKEGLYELMTKTK